MRSFVSTLRRELENANHMVVSPPGGLSSSINDVRLGLSRHIDVELDHDGVTSLLRIIPVIEEITEEAGRPGVYHFHSAIGVFLDEDGQETGNMVEVYVFFNTQVTTDGMPIGTLRMWHLTTGNTIVEEDSWQ